MDGEGTASPGVLEIRVAEGPADWVIAHQMLDDEHLLGAGREARLNLSTKSTKIYLLRKQAMKSGTSNLKGLLAACRT
jgi:hypothetical protein